jgi:hypothetical protein
MLWLLQNILFSISLIVVIHYLYIYFETTLTAPKVKDLIHCPKQKYKSLFDTINKNLDNNVSQQNKGGGTREHSRDLGTTSVAGAGTGTGIEDRNDNEFTSEYSAYNEPNGKSNMNKGVNDMKTDLKAFLRGIGLKSKSNSENSFRPSYEMS